MRRAFAFLSIFGGAATPTPMTFVWFPFVGVVLGLIVGSAWWASDRLWPHSVAAVVTVIVDLALTGLLHFDGLADAGDGLLAPMKRERRLAAMSDPAIGAFGLMSVVAVLLLRVSALAATRPSILAIGGLWCASRTSMLGISLILPYARSNGIVRSFLGATPRSRAHSRMLGATVGVGLLAAAALLGGARSFRGLAALGAELVAIAMVALLSWRKVGGFTGDVLGASGVIGETLGLLVLAVR
ncbi:MAG: adenosylcobinamide-GDP ribazoletransferase [Acidimicrobiaceae bacterium]|nr:adenosylcobinamide-GDP ribazoletransferase [Acidimicrobiaceae bacterium]